MPQPTQSTSRAPALSHRQLSWFRALMLHGSVSRAAEACHTSQPTLSRELARLEQLLGYALFDRVRGRLRPTARALALLQEVERSFIGLEQIAQRAHELRGMASNRVRIACLPALAHALLPQVLRRVALQLPQAAISVVPLESPWLEQALIEQRVDLGLSEIAEPPPGLELLGQWQTSEVVVLPARHPLALRQSTKTSPPPNIAITPHDLAGLPFISLAPNDPYRQAIDQLFADLGIERQLLLETSSAVAVCAMVQQGLGVSIVNPLSAAALEPTGIAVRPLSVDIPFRVSLLQASQTEVSDEALPMHALLREAIHAEMLR
ncbi:LysR family transcriptional regulator [Curvibacter sp. CHRR-16]|uniref:LysR family transcriptional regulator n=1 Tax=Curvibacter sp. CHRR-16 TaxID=2835872 RepID=UPI001BDB1DA1|nr:LysR family transcriptional regulator [Curvibacter sp. CHRR-16]MBT0570811.1 LysR family transcriptional regulator [Curvibacter sp. CHRR-16]